MRRGAVVLAVVACVFMVIPPGHVYAKTVYVRDWIVINIRSMPSDASETVAFANTEDQLELVEESGGWSKIRTREGKEGWVGSRFLTDRPPKGIYIKQLEVKVKALQDENTRLKGIKPPEKPGIIPPSTMGTGSIAAPIEGYTEGCPELKARYDKLLSENKDCTRERNVLVAENSRLRTSERLFFTFIGGVFIVLGVLIGLFIQMVSGRSKKQGYRF